MKKLLVLLLVFGLASAANAAIVSLSVDGVNPSDGTEDIDVASPTIVLSVLDDTDTHVWLMEVTVLKADATLGTPTPTVKAGGMASWNDWSDATWWIYELSTAGSPPDTPLAGQQWYMNLTSLKGLGETFTVNIGEYGMPVAHSIEFTMVPEPMTVALLGLGGLLLLRRRK
jgi:hypothetical protein